MKKYFPLVLLAAAAIGAAQVTAVIMEQQIRLRTPAAPGAVLTVAPDGVSLIPQTAPSVHVIGTPQAPGCVAAPNPGTYTLPRPAAAVAVYRNGIRASTTGEFTLTGNTVKMADPIAGEIVLCDFTY